VPVLLKAGLSPSRSAKRSQDNRANNDRLVVADLCPPTTTRDSWLWAEPHYQGRVYTLDVIGSIFQLEDMPTVAFRILRPFSVVQLDAASVAFAV
jgi:hypothetical protein